MSRALGQHLRSVRPRLARIRLGPALLLPRWVWAQAASGSAILLRRLQLAVGAVMLLVRQCLPPLRLPALPQALEEREVQAALLTPPLLRPLTVVLVLRSSLLERLEHPLYRVRYRPLGQICRLVLWLRAGSALVVQPCRFLLET